jgi:small-conductance mechanosensitive channel
LALITLLLCLGRPGLIPMVRAAETSVPAESPIAPEQIKTSLEGALSSNKAELAELKTQLRQLEILQDTVRTDININDAQNTAHSQLLLASQLRIEDLQNAIKNNRRAAMILEDRIEAFQRQLESSSTLLEQAASRVDLARKQMDDIRRSPLPAAQVEALETAARELFQVLKDKKSLGERRLEIYQDMLAQIQGALDANKALGQKLNAELASREKTLIFQRSEPYRRLLGGELPEALRFFASRVAAVFKAATWKAQWAQVKLGGLERWAMFLFVIAVVLVLQGRLRGCLQNIEKRCDGPGWHHHCLGLLLLRRSLTLLSLTLVLEIYQIFQFSVLNASLVRAFSYALLYLLMTRWGLDYLEFSLSGPPTALRSYVVRRLKHFFQVFRIAAILLILLVLFAGSDSLLNWLARTLISAVFLILAVAFWQQMKPVVAEGLRDGQAAPAARRIVLFQGGTYLIFGGALMISLAGYGVLAAMWLAAWMKTVALVFWGWLSLNAVREWHQDHRAVSAAADEEKPLTSGHHWRWSLIQLARVVWFVGLAAGIVWAWDRAGFLRLQLGRLVNLTFTVGSLQLSIKGILLAVLIVYITHLAVRIGRVLLNQQILAKQALDRGLRDSILTISSYLGWGLGLVLALGVLGVNATSLAVIFGALSIGIGFGLQTIFNNFISGLILLFERPIQVGDVVEVGGLFAEVKQINVRATVVQTFDNASVIIPNSEFISQQVTNWSFKDKRMRRNIAVGVAYGSDIDLVQRTLLEIAQQKRRVLKYPRPDVLFTDHADSALIFRLRIWVHVDDYWNIPSEIRCEIDRRFRELDIEIAFPQRDLHIRSYPEKGAPADPVPE